MLRVSIHAPARGATISLALTQSAKVSIHAPAGGATRLLTNTIAQSCVSIHAPAGGATAADSDVMAYQDGFNPRARAGRDRLWPGWIY